MGHYQSFPLTDLMCPWNNWIRGPNISLQISPLCRWEKISWIRHLSPPHILNNFGPATYLMYPKPHYWTEQCLAEPNSWLSDLNSWPYGLLFASNTLANQVTISLSQKVCFIVSTRRKGKWQISLLLKFSFTVIFIVGKVDYFFLKYVTKVKWETYGIKNKQILLLSWLLFMV